MSSTIRKSIPARRSTSTSIPPSGGDTPTSCGFSIWDGTGWTSGATGEGITSAIFTRPTARSGKAWSPPSGESGPSPGSGDRGSWWSSFPWPHRTGGSAILTATSTCRWRRPPGRKDSRSWISCRSSFGTLRPISECRRRTVIPTRSGMSWPPRPSPTQPSPSSSEEDRMPSSMKRAFLMVLLLFLGGVGAEISAILLINSGHLVYTLDDAYIHLSLAENIARGHYGVNLGESSSPSSSILWPFLLAPVAGSALGTLAPLVLNVLVSLGTVFLFWRVVGVAMGDYQTDVVSSTALPTLLVSLLIVATNLIGLIFTGMEHSLQVFLVTLIVWGLIQESRGGKADWWLVLSLILAPLVRYESLAISVPGLLYLFLRRHRKEALTAAVILGMALWGFSAFLVHLGLDPLPDSTMVKSKVVSSGGNLRLMVRHFGGSLNNPRGSVLAAVCLALCWLSCSGGRKPAERLFAWWIATGVALHLLAGEYGWYSRYEIYIWTASVLSVLYLGREALSRRLARDGPYAVGFLAGLTVVLTCLPYIPVLGTAPLP